MHAIMIMIVVDVDKRKQTNVCYLNAVDIEKSEEDGEEY